MCWWVWLAENHLHSKWHYFMGRQMYKSSEEKEYKQTSAEGEVGQASPTAPEVCMPQSHSRVLREKFFAAPHLPGYYTGNCIEREKERERFKLNVWW